MIFVFRDGCWLGEKVTVLVLISTKTVFWADEFCSANCGRLEGTLSKPVCGSLHFSYVWPVNKSCRLAVTLFLNVHPPFLSLSLTFFKKKEKEGFTYPTTALNLKVQLTLNFSYSYLLHISSGVAVFCVQGVGDRVGFLHAINWASSPAGYLQRNT